MKENRYLWVCHNNEILYAEYIRVEYTQRDIKLARKILYNVFLRLYNISVDIEEGEFEEIIKMQTQNKSGE
jgi:hypothetical protein